ncbi:MAG TPA: HAMP domain-containing sensor histidine kinase [Burkholderiaceae bacterium]|nr:HAMP domain-containing sensor histidine kinase [Burkholderiaceae bacterium]
MSADELRARLAEAARAIEARDEAIRARDDFLAIAAHELRNPLHSLSMQLSLLHKVTSRSGDQDAARRAERAGKALRHFVRRSGVLLDVARLNSGLFRLNPETVCLAETVGDVTDLLAEEARFRGVEIECAVSGPLIGWWDRQAIEQVLSNLLTNAIKYGAGRPVSVSAAATGDDTVQIVVRDRGPGISVADQQRVFGKFERLVQGRMHTEGFGLGLWIVRQLVSAHGGAISIHSRIGEGARFTVTLPVTSTGTATTHGSVGDDER